MTTRGESGQDAPMTTAAREIGLKVRTQEMATRVTKKVTAQHHRAARKQTRSAAVMKSIRRMRAKARDASIRARESAATAAAAEPAPKARSCRTATAVVGVLVAMTWWRRRGDSDGRSDRSR